MSSGIAQGDLTALTQAMLAKHPVKDFYNTFNFSSYPFANEIVKKRTETNGRNINYTVSTTENGNARATRPYQTDAINITSTVVQGSVNTVFFDTHWAWDKRELALNGASPEQIFNTLDLKRVESMKSAAELIEGQGFQVPENASDDLHINGVPYQFRFMNTGTTTNGFVGQTVIFGDGTTATTKDGIDLSTSANARLRNWAGIHSEKIDQNFIKTLREGMIDTKCDPPMMVKDGKTVKSGNIMGYWPKAMLLKWYDWVDKTGSNYGGEGKMGSPLLNIDLTHVPSLDVTSTSDTDVVRAKVPLYFINWDALKIYNQSGYWMNESRVLPMDNNHNGCKVFVDWSLQLVVPNPRYAGFVLHKSF